MKKETVIKKESANNKAMFLQRLVAYLIDSAIVVFIASLISVPFINNDKVSDLNDKSYELIEKYRSNKISNNEYIAEYMNISYDLAKSEGIVTLISVVAGLIVFSVIPFYKNGQTIGKKLLKIKIVSKTGDLSMNQLIFRAFIANSILLNLISVILIMISSKNSYFYCYGMFTIIQYIVTAISIFMIIVSKDGRAIHDRIVGTKVIKIYERI